MIFIYPKNDTLTYFSSWYIFSRPIVHYILKLTLQRFPTNKILKTLLII